MKLSDITTAQDMGIELELAEGLQAGFPSPAQDYAGETIDLAREMVRHPESTFYARIAGNSMIEAGIHDGDIVVIDRSLEAQNGNYVAACIDGEFTIKEYQFDTKNQCNSTHAFTCCINSFSGWLAPGICSNTCIKL